MKWTKPVISIFCVCLCVFFGALIVYLQQKSPVHVGTIENSYPFHFSDAEGDSLGMNVDLINGLNSASFHEIDLSAYPKNRLLEKFLNQEIDVLMGPSLEGSILEKYVTALGPGYAGPDILILTRNNVQIRSWENLSKRRVCLQLEEGIGEALIDEYQLKPVLFKTNEMALNALKNGRCAAFLQSTLSLDIVDKTFGATYTFLSLDENKHYFYCLKENRSCQKVMGQVLTSFMKTDAFRKILLRWRFYQFQKTQNSLVQREP